MYVVRVKFMRHLKKLRFSRCLANLALVGMGFAISAPAGFCQTGDQAKASQTLIEVIAYYRDGSRISGAVPRDTLKISSKDLWFLLPSGNAYLTMDEVELEPFQLLLDGDTDLLTKLQTGASATARDHLMKMDPADLKWIRIVDPDLNRELLARQYLDFNRELLIEIDDEEKIWVLGKEVSLEDLAEELDNLNLPDGQDTILHLAMNRSMTRKQQGILQDHLFGAGYHAIGLGSFPVKSARVLPNTISEELLEHMPTRFYATLVVLVGEQITVNGMTVKDSDEMIEKLKRYGAKTKSSVDIFHPDPVHKAKYEEARSKILANRFAIGASSDPVKQKSKTPTFRGRPVNPVPAKAVPVKPKAVPVKPKAVPVKPKVQTAPAVKAKALTK